MALSMHRLHDVKGDAPGDDHRRILTKRSDPV
eukprot:CAMPEP_0174344664 /NCGR_PEP_ID=MMETSP0810-20121108/27798_1 /TAXON_ID=73025 ORGANISM="Eutreptiella gymnastica-like, Strain CCMP1594" /NCGR_SAMPLE_ID=MMETSP0810 /ASSEMBLY_ACC=CAM_ASM_000659 /LENGTH=31 /DNA_ID= /DNA_START= /DNA_END= /DNA_ORIENTATION=